MLTTEAMELLSIAVLKTKAEEISSHLLRLGVFHPVDISHIEEALKDLSHFQIDKEYSSYEALQARLSDIVRKTGITLSPQKEVRDFSYDYVDRRLEQVQKEVDPLIVKKGALYAELKTKESMLSHITEYVPFSLERPASSYTFLKVELGGLEEKNIPILERSLKSIPHIFYPFKKEGSKVVMLFIGLRRDRDLIDKVLKDLAWQKLDYEHEPQALSKDVIKKINDEIESCKKNIEEVDRSVNDIRIASEEEVSGLNSFISVKKSLLEAKKYSCMTEKTVLISGWVPREEKDRIIRALNKIDASAFIEDKRAEDVSVPKEEIPVRLKHTRLFKPFELLIGAYGIPRYGSIDPTIFVAISFLIMFGAMFGDSGQGLVLSIISLFLWKNKEKKVRQAGTLIFYCGISSEIFGILYGSFFGYEFKSLWIKPLSSILQIFKLSIAFGVVMISLGILLNVANAMKDKDYLKVLFDKAGLIAGIIYWTGIAIIAKLLVYRNAFQPIYLIIILACALLLFFKPVIEFFIKKKKENLFTSFIESTIDILEIIMGYLANTVSFIRIAAFALAHTGLFLSIFELSRLLKGVGGGSVSFLIIFFGNVLIILLEGLVVSIQSLRLSYYEFFSKFFVSGKRLYKPLTF